MRDLMKLTNTNEKVKEMDENYFYEQPPSVYFVTFHKTASSFFASTVLKNIDGLTQVNYAGTIFNNRIVNDITFEKFGHIYGPIRLTLDSGPVFEIFIKELYRQKLLFSERVICFIRDPREMLVSRFYSRAYSHPESKNGEIRAEQQKKRQTALSLGIDDFVMQEMKRLIPAVEMMKRILENNTLSILLRYEDMITDYEAFYSTFMGIVSLTPGMKQLIYDSTRIQEVENIYSHRRSGRTRSFHDKLRPETIDILNW